MNKLRQDISIGTNLKKLRKEKGYTQEKISAKLQLAGSKTTRSIYSRYETGELNIRVSDLILLKQILQCGYDDFFIDIEPEIFLENN